MPAPGAHPCPNRHALPVRFWFSLLTSEFAAHCPAPRLYEAGKYEVKPEFQTIGKLCWRRSNTGQGRGWRLHRVQLPLGRPDGRTLIVPGRRNTHLL